MDPDANSLLAVLACGWLMLNLSVETWIRFVAWMAIGVVVYFAYGRHKSVLGQRLRAEQQRVDEVEQVSEPREVPQPEPV